MAKIELRIHFNGQSESSLKRIIPEPSFPSRGSQARGTRLKKAHKELMHGEKTFRTVVKYFAIKKYVLFLRNVLQNLVVSTSKNITFGCFILF